jgi:hypothetical protein
MTFSGMLGGHLTPPRTPNKPSRRGAGHKFSSYTVPVYAVDKLCADETDALLGPHRLRKALSPPFFTNVVEEPDVPSQYVDYRPRAYRKDAHLLSQCLYQDWKHTYPRSFDSRCLHKDLISSPVPANAITPPAIISEDVDDSFSDWGAGKRRSPKKTLIVSDRPSLKVVPKRFFNTTRCGGRYDGPNDELEAERAADRKRSVDTASTLPTRRPKTSTFRRPAFNIFQRNPSGRNTSSIKSPDRFLPRRPALGSVSQSYRINKDPHSLSNAEKLIRNSDASPDAFNPRRRVTSPIPFAHYPLPRRNLTMQRNGGGASVLALQRDPQITSGERTISIGTVWTVGGVAPANSIGASDGPRRLASVGNAPLYTTSFSVSRPKPEEEREKHEGRLAQALDLDRVARILEFRDSSTSPLRQDARGHDKANKSDSKTIWNGTEWVIGGRDHKIPMTPEVRATFRRSCDTLYVLFAESAIGTCLEEASGS